MSDFDDHILRDKLQRLGGHLPDENAAYADLQRGVRTAKRRRMAIASGGFAATCVAVLVITGLGGHTNQTVTTATDGATVPGITDVSEVAGPSTTESTTTIAATTTIESTTTIAPETTVSPVVETAAPPAAPSAPGGSAGGANASTSGTRHPTSPSTAPTAPTETTHPDQAEDPAGNPPAPTTETRTFSAAHGSITVELVSGHLELRGHQTQDGYDYRVERDSGDRIRVSFSNDQHTSRIDVTIVDGRLAVQVEESSSGSDVPTSSSIDDHSDFGSGGTDGGSGPGHG